MKKSLHINLRSYFGAALDELVSCKRKPAYSLRYADEHYYRRQDDWAIAQEFDGKNGYLYAYELRFHRRVSIPVRMEMADLHVVYLIEGSAALHISDAMANPVCSIPPQRARYLHVPPGDYQLELKAGHYQLFGFYFDGGIFRDGNERGFRFLHEVIQSYRERSTQPVASIDFPVGPRTLQYIQYLCRHLKKGDFDNEAFVLTELSRLVKLSKQKVFDEYERTSDPELLIQRCRKLLAEYIADQGNTTRIKDIAQQLNVRPEYLSRLHQRYFKQTLSGYRSGLLVKRIKDVLAEPFSLLEVAMRCGFPGSSELNRFFKQKCGMTPADYRNLLHDIKK